MPDAATHPSVPYLNAVPPLTAPRIRRASAYCVPESARIRRFTSAASTSLPIERAHEPVVALLALLAPHLERQYRLHVAVHLSPVRSRHHRRDRSPLPHHACLPPRPALCPETSSPCTATPGSDGTRRPRSRTPLRRRAREPNARSAIALRPVAVELRRLGLREQSRRASWSARPFIAVA